MKMSVDSSKNSCRDLRMSKYDTFERNSSFKLLIFYRYGSVMQHSRRRLTKDKNVETCYNKQRIISNQREK